MTNAAQPWLARYPKGVPTTVSEQPISMPQMLANAVAEHGERPALSYGDEIFTYKQLAGLAARIAKGLQNLGLKPGDRIAVLSPNHPATPAWFFGAMSAGIALVSINPLYPAANVEHMITDSGARVALTLDAPDTRAKLEPLLRPGALEKLVLMREGVHDLQPASQGAVDLAPTILSLSVLMNNAGDYLPAEINPLETPAALQYTGGTTGFPKGAVLTHANLTTNTLQIASWFPFLKAGEEKILIPLPFSHITGVTVCMAFAVRIAAELIVLPRFMPDEMIEVLRTKRATFVGGVPTIIVALLQTKTVPADWTSVKAVIGGGAPVPPDVMKQFYELTGQRFRQIYGSTEMSPAATIMTDYADAPPASAGLPIPGTIVEIRDAADHTKVMPNGKTGEIVVKGPQIMKGYWKREEETATYLVDGYFRTGDIGYIDDNGYIFIVDRLNDMIIASGYNIYPANVENAIFGHPAVIEAIVIGVPDSYRGETVKAYVTLKPGMSLTLEELQAFLKGKLSPMEMPKLMEIRAQLPKTAVGKLSRLDLKREITQ